MTSGSGAPCRGSDSNVIVVHPGAASDPGVNVSQWRLESSSAGQSLEPIPRGTMSFPIPAISRRNFLGRMASLSTLPLLTAGCGSGGAVVPGIEVLLNRETALIRGRRVGLITNHTGVDRRLRHDIDLLRALPEVELAALFAPEHGIAGMVPAGAGIESLPESRWGIPVHSLYGATTQPTEEMVRGLDLLIYDIQDVGSRYYTYLATLRNCLQAAGRFQIPLIVLDRPNPLGGLRIEGRLLDPRLQSLVGPAAIPARYGLTPGELAAWMKFRLNLQCSLTVVKMRHWERAHWFADTGLVWVPPSPNVPSAMTALVYAGMCLLEGTNLSEGRGTATPFEIAGAPWVDGPRAVEAMDRLKLPGVAFRHTRFRPGASKFSGQVCDGIQLHVVHPGRFQPLRTALCLIAHFRRTHSQDFKWAERHFDRLAGSEEVRRSIDRDQPVEEMLEGWRAELADFEKERRDFFLY